VRAELKAEVLAVGLGGKPKMERDHAQTFTDHALLALCPECLSLRPPLPWGVVFLCFSCAGQILLLRDQNLYDDPWTLVRKKSFPREDCVKLVTWLSGFCENYLQPSR
jgi:hypothetical protein